MSERPSEYRILVIDDEIFVRELLEEYFGRLEYEVVTAESGDQGIQAISDQCFGVVLVDLKMPGKDGIETLREIRRADPLCLIVIMTGYPTIDSSIEALRSGAYDYIIKPFKLGELREVVERAAKEYQLKVEIDRIQRNIKTVEGELRDYRSSQGYAGEGFAASDSQKDGGHLQAQIRELDCLRDAGHLSAGEYETKRRDLSSHR